MEKAWLKDFNDTQLSTTKRQDEIIIKMTFSAAQCWFLIKEKTPGTETKDCKIEVGTWEAE